MNNSKILSDIAYKKLSSLVLTFEKSYIMVKLSDNLYSHINMILMLNDTNDENIVELSTNIYHNGVYIIDFLSKRQNLGYGKQVLKCFNHIITDYLPHIDYITGFLSPVDFSRWNKIIYMYTKYISNSKMIIANQFSPNEFLKITNNYKHSMVRFKLFLK